MGLRELPLLIAGGDAMTCRGIVKGRTIELEQDLPYLEGQPVNITVQPIQQDDVPGSPAFVLRAMDRLEHLEPGDIEEFEKAIQEAKRPVRYTGIFDQGLGR
jgi:hypothetical protein